VQKDVKQRNEARAKLFEQIREEERLKREAKEESLSGVAAKKPLSKGATRKRSSKKRQAPRTGGRSKG